MSDEKNVKIEQEKVVLKRELGLVGATSLVVGTIIGAGIFISPKGVLQNTGSVGLCLVVWVTAGVISLGSSLCTVELGTMINLSGGMYTYIRLGLGNMLAFMFVSQRVLVRNSMSLLILLLTFSKYTVSMFPTCGSPKFLEKMIAATTLVTLVTVNMYSSRLASRLSILTTIGKVFALLVIIVGGLVTISQGTTHELTSGFSGTKTDPTSIALAFYSALWSYSGSTTINNLVEEIKSPSKNIPRAAIFGSLLTIGIYVLTNVSYLAVMTRSELLKANAVAALFGERVLQSFSIVIPLSVMVSTLGSSNNSIFSNSRITFTAARDGNLPDYLSYIHVKQFTPFGAMTLTVTLSLLYLFPSDLSQLINLAGFLDSIFDACVTLSLLYLFPSDLSQLINLAGFLDSIFDACVFLSLIRFRLWTMKDVPRPVKIPIFIPVLMFLVNIYLFIAPVIIRPRLEYIYVAVGVAVTSAMLYIPFIYFHFRLPFYDKIVTWMQLIFEICPPSQPEK